MGSTEGWSKSYPVDKWNNKTNCIILGCAKHIYMGVCIYLVAKFCTLGVLNEAKIWGVMYGTR